MDGKCILVTNYCYGATIFETHTVEYSESCSVVYRIQTSSNIGLILSVVSGPTLRKKWPTFLSRSIIGIAQLDSSLDVPICVPSWE